MGPYTLFPPLSLLLPSMPIPTYFHHHHLLPLAYSHLLLPLLLTHTYLFPPTCSRLLSPSLLASAIIAYSSILLASTYFIAYFPHHHLLSPTSAIIAYSRLLPPLPPTCSCLCCLLPPLPLAYFHHHRLLTLISIIVVSLGTSLASTYFTICLPILVGMFELRVCPLCLVFPHLLVQEVEHRRHGSHLQFSNFWKIFLFVFSL